VLGNVREIFWPCASPDMGCPSSDRSGNFVDGRHITTNLSSINFSSFPFFQVFPHLPSFPPSSNPDENVITDTRLCEFFWGGGHFLDTKMKCVRVKITSSHATVLPWQSRIAYRLCA
jgi:hypothetical protein